jgi:hypothetical protein
MFGTTTASRRLAPAVSCAPCDIVSPWTYSNFTRVAQVRAARTRLDLRSDCIRALGQLGTAPRGRSGESARCADIGRASKLIWETSQLFVQVGRGTRCSTTATLTPRQILDFQAQARSRKASKYAGTVIDMCGCDAIDGSRTSTANVGTRGTRLSHRTPRARRVAPSGDTAM